MPSWSNLLSDIREEGLVEVAKRARTWAGLAAIAALEGEKEGVAVVDEDWDTLVILDACRYDSFEAVNSLPGTLKRRTSRASVTWSFLRQNFEGKKLHDIVYLSSNAVVGNTSEALDVYKLVGLWPDPDSEGNGTTNVLPEETVKKAIELHDAYPNKRLIVHFLPPHTPFLIKDGEKIPSDSMYRDYQAAMAGEVSSNEMRNVYEENLEYVLEHVEELVGELDGKTVVTADHGELIGEGISPLYEILHPRWPITKRRNFDYTHYSHVRKSELVDIPWLEVASDGERRHVEADNPVEAEMNTSNLDEHLEALGYKA